jgi:valyl-tRNA synthetase
VETGKRKNRSGGTLQVQDEDVPDTWFSSGCAPSPLWIAGRYATEIFLPKNVLVTSYDKYFSGWPHDFLWDRDMGKPPFSYVNITDLYATTSDAKCPVVDNG